MKLSLNWIKDYVEIPADIELSRIAYDLTMATVEVEGMIELAQAFDKMVLGLVKEILPHPDADKLLLCKVDIGGGDIREIVCGGTNLREGMKVAVARPGAMVRWHGEGDLVAIKKAKVRGVESYGMICASSEIGLFDLFPYTDEGTIVDLSDFGAQAGTALADALDLNDVILEIDNKSLTNRPDLWGHYGIARELSALYDLPLKELGSYKPPAAAEFKISIKDTLRCPRYLALEMEGLAVKPAPFEIQSRIWRVGMRPINAIVDITNYLMLTTGQPTHAFDSDKIKGSIVVRLAQDSEKLLLLDDKDLSLSREDLVIADEEGPVGLAGVMGGKRDSVLPGTKRVILEIANFDAIGIRRTATRYASRTESSMRFEKGLDAERVEATLALAMGLFSKIFPEISIRAYADSWPVRKTASELIVSLDWLEKRLGKRIANTDISRILSRLGFDVDFDGDELKLKVPSWRSTGDISRPEDIIEEVARVYGYENFETLPISSSFEKAIDQPKIDLDRRIREYLSFRCGMQEIYTYPWLKEEYTLALFGSVEGLLSLAQPPAPDEKYLRSSLLPSLCRAVESNLRFFDEFSIYESAHVFFDRDYENSYDKREALPLQKRMLAAAYVGKAENINVLFRKAKGTVSALANYVHIEPIAFKQIDKPVWADDVLWLNITAEAEPDKKIGNLALLSKKACLDCGIKNSSVMIFEFDIDALQPLSSRSNDFTHIPEYPLVGYDLSLLFDLSVKWSEILSDIKGASNSLLQDVFFVDEYRGQQIPEGKKSLTFRLLIGSLEKTLTSDEIENCAKAVIKRLKKTMGAELRA